MRISDWSSDVCSSDRSIACALANRTVGLEDFVDDALRRPTVAALARKVEPQVDPVIESEWGRTISPAELVVETDSGVLRARVDHARGGRGNAMNPEAFDRKPRDCLARLEDTTSEPQSLKCTTQAATGL